MSHEKCESQYTPRYPKKSPIQALSRPGPERLTIIEHRLGHSAVHTQIYVNVRRYYIKDNKRHRERDVTLRGISICYNLKRLGGGGRL